MTTDLHENTGTTNAERTARREQAIRDLFDLTEHMSMDQAAEVLGVSPQTVRKRYASQMPLKPVSQPPAGRRDTSWMEHGACKDVDPELFWPDSRGPDPKGNRYRAARPVCKRCPVRPECLEWATATRQVGFWGGTTDEERRAGQ